LESFPEISWQDDDGTQQNENPQQPATKRRKIKQPLSEGEMRFSLGYTYEPLFQPLRPRLVRSRRLHSQLHKLQESSLVSSSYFQYTLRKAQETSLWLDSLANIDDTVLVKDEDDDMDEIVGFEFQMQVVA
jgi:hypothetical protein